MSVNCYKENLLKEFVSNQGWHLTAPINFSFETISYDFRQVDESTLFFVKV